jgi:hypothetical protein
MSAQIDLMVSGDVEGPPSNTLILSYHRDPILISIFPANHFGAFLLLGRFTALK